jgi:hypothetical protein
MANRRSLTLADRQALAKIRELLSRYPGQYGRLDDPLTRRYAQELLRYPPAEAIIKAEQYRQEVKEHNDKQEALTEKAKERRAELRQKPIYSLGRTGLAGILLRSFMASLNWTPLLSPNWYELTDRGLIVHTPFANVTERVITHGDLVERRRELGVNPPTYFDSIIGFLKQLRITAKTPWGTITLREPGSGVVLGEVVEIRPDDKLALIRRGLADIHRANEPYAAHLVLPKLVDFFSYYIDEWDEEFHLTPAAGEPEDEQLAASPDAA